jgi:hypothetical protein
MSEKAQDKKAQDKKAQDKPKGGKYEDEPDANILRIRPLKTNKSKIKINSLMQNHQIPKHPSSIMFCGKSGAGKTMLLLNLLDSKEMYGTYFDLIFLFSETAKEGGDDLYQVHCGEDSNSHIPEEHMFRPDKEGLAQLDHIIKTQKEIVKEKGLDKSPKILVIFDDIAHSRKFLASRQYLLLHIANRHLNISTFSLTQSYVKIPRSARCQVSAVAFFHGGTNTERLRLSEEHTPSKWSEKEFMELINHACSNKYDFLFINKHADMKNRYRKNLDTILELQKY